MIKYREYAWGFLEVWRENGRFEVVIGAQQLPTNYCVRMIHSFLIVLTTIQGSSPILVRWVWHIGICNLVCNFYKSYLY